MPNTKTHNNQLEIRGVEKQLFFSAFWKKLNNIGLFFRIKGKK